MDPYSTTRFHIKPEPTDIFGLRFFPNLEPDCSNDQDSPAFGNVNSPEITDDNRKLIRMVMQELGDNLHAIVEIGVNRNSEMSMSQILIHERPKGSFYLGIDLEDKSELNDITANTHTLMCNSHDQTTVREFLSSKGIQKIDLLFIDGWHSVNSSVNDWRYADLLSSHGIVLMHDTNSHPGPIALFEAIDGEKFNKERHFPGYFDNGLAVIKMHK